jgi:hypothetical protein
MRLLLKSLGPGVITGAADGYPRPSVLFIEDHQAEGFRGSVALSEEQVCGPRFMRDFVAACKTMLPLVEFTTRVLGLKF